MRWLLVALALSGLLAACSAEIPDATYVCSDSSECPPGLLCDAARGLCVRDVPCTPLTCEDLRAECGSPDDRCGGTLDCGTCDGEDTCGGGGVDFICGCEPRTCADAGAECGAVSPGCGLPDLNCGGCAFPNTCGGGGTPHQCGCEAPDACAGVECGEVENACGEVVTCGDCPTGEFCTLGTCGTTMCIPATDPCGGATCGSAPDGCGMLVSCGACASPDTCMGGTCTCIATTTCDSRGLECGDIMDECGATSPCSGTCSDREMCETNLCICTPDGFEDNDVETMATGRTAMLGTGVRDVISGATIDSTGDDDYWQWSFDAVDGVPTSGGMEIQLSRIGARVGDDFDLEAWITCTGPRTDTTTCAAPATSLAGREGCRSATPGSEATTETILLYPGCVAGTLYVRVVATIGGNNCEPYELAVRY